MLITNNSVTIASERTIPTVRPPLVGGASVRIVAWSARQIPTAVISNFLDRSCYFFFKVAPQL
jgi:hypothetical protein